MEKERRETLKKLQKAQEAYHNVCEEKNTFRKCMDGRLLQIGELYRSAAKADLDRIFYNMQEEPVSDIKSPQSYYDATERMRIKVTAALREAEAILNQAVQRTNADLQLTGVSADIRSFQAATGEKDASLDIASIDFRYHGESPADGGKKETEDIPWQEEKKALYEEYLALAAMTDALPQKAEDFSDREMLRREINKLSDAYRKKDEMDYIADQINEVMADFGYTFVTSKVLTRQDDAETDYSLYQADEETGVEVYTDQAGTVMMRMAVLGGDPMVTEEDRAFSYQRQIDFCAGHVELVEALAERGIYLKQKSYEAPDRKFTYKIRIAKEGDTSTGNAVQKSTAERGIDRRRRRRAGSKKMRTM